MQLRDDFPLTDMAVLVDSADECGLVDDDSSRIRANNILNNGPQNGAYNYIGIGLVVLTITPG